MRDHNRVFTVFLKVCGYSLILGITGCDQIPHAGLNKQGESSATSVRYQLVAGNDGAVWKLDVTTGEMRTCFSYSPANHGPTCITVIEK
jgi:hypothetical protein